jgi:predicted nuclease of predicted toxin-antitoxin system
VRLLIDELFPPSLAEQMRQRGHNVVAVAERSDLRGQPDDVIFAQAQGEGRAIVTENVADFRLLATDAIQRGRPHNGLIFTSVRRYPRHDNRTVGRLVRALDAMVHSALDLRSIEHWLSWSGTLSGRCSPCFQGRQDILNNDE